MCFDTVNLKEINDLFKMLTSSVDYYQKAVGDAESSRVKSRLLTVRNQHAFSIAALKPYANLDDGGVGEVGGFAIGARSMYTQALAKLHCDSDLNFIYQIEEIEDQILDKMNNIDEASLPDSVREVFKQVRFQTSLTHRDFWFDS